jgi:hypothetical protein
MFSVFRPVGREDAKLLSSISASAEERRAYTEK